jgi:hypothetical protein
MQGLAAAVKALHSQAHRRPAAGRHSRCCPPTPCCQTELAHLVNQAIVLGLLGVKVLVAAEVSGHLQAQQHVGQRRRQRGAPVERRPSRALPALYESRCGLPVRLRAGDP